MKKLIALVVVAGIAAGGWYLYTHNWLPAQEKAKQKQTVSDVRNTGTAWMSWLTDQVGASLERNTKYARYERNSSRLPIQSAVYQSGGAAEAKLIQVTDQLAHSDWFGLRSAPEVTFAITMHGKPYTQKYKKVPFETMKQMLHPDETFFYMQEVPKTDGWGNELEFYLNTDLLGAHVLLVRSPGRDGKFSGNSYAQGKIGPDQFDEDIVYADGYMIRQP